MKLLTQLAAQALDVELMRSYIFKRLQFLVAVYGTCVFMTTTPIICNRKSSTLYDRNRKCLSFFCLSFAHMVLCNMQGAWIFN